jgi:hypothetical protein
MVSLQVLLVLVLLFWALANGVSSVFIQLASQCIAITSRVNHFVRLNVYRQHEKPEYKCITAVVLGLFFQLIPVFFTEITVAYNYYNYYNYFGAIRRKRTISDEIKLENKIETEEDD